MIRKRGERLGTVEAATEKEAIKVAIKEFEIEPARQNRIAVRKLGGRYAPAWRAPACRCSCWRRGCSFLAS
jgi:hypothetical protein